MAWGGTGVPQMKACTEGWPGRTAPSRHPRDVRSTSLLLVRGGHCDAQVVRKPATRVLLDAAQPRRGKHAPECSRHSSAAAQAHARTHS